MQHKATELKVDINNAACLMIISLVQKWKAAGEDKIVCLVYFVSLKLAQILWPEKQNTLTAAKL